MDYGASDTSTTNLGANQFPIGETWTPNAGFSAVEGGPQSTDAGGKKSAPVSVYAKDGNDLTQGAQADPTYTSGSGSIISLLKGIFGKVAGTLTISGAVTTSGTVTEANSAASKADLDTIVTNTNKIPASPATEGGHLATIDTSTANANTAIGTKTDSKATDGSVTAWSVIALLKGIIDKLLNTLAVTQSGTWTVQPGNTANTTAWKVDGSGVTQPVSGTVTANAGSGTFNNQQSNVQADYDSGAGTQNVTMQGIALPASGGAVPGGTSTNPVRTDPTGTTIQPVSGTVTANAGTNLNTSLLALESGGNLATLAGAIASAIMQANVKQINGVTPLMGNGTTGTGSQRVTIASDNTAFTSNAAQSGTWTVQPGNTANTTPWLVSANRVAVSLFSTTQTAQPTGNSGDLNVGPYTELAIDINITANPAGSNPTIQFEWDRKGADNLYYPIWLSDVINGLPANPTKLSVSIGAGLEWAQSLGTTGRLVWTVGGTASPTYTFTPNVSGK